MGDDGGSVDAGGGSSKCCGVPAGSGCVASAYGTLGDSYSAVPDAGDSY